MKHNTPRKFVGLVVLVIGFCVSAAADAQQRELTNEDRLAILYAPQLDFTQRGDPMIRVGLLEGRDEIEFEPTEPIRVMPRGDQGAEVVLPADTTYEVSISDSKGGTYKHWVIVEELLMSQRDRVDSVREEWSGRGYTPEALKVGGVFGLRGNVFDSRRILVGVGGTETIGRAREIRERLVGRYGIEGRIHSELTEHPSGRLTLTSKSEEIEVRHRDVMWIAPARDASREIEYRVPRVPTPRGEGVETRTYGGRLVISPDREGSIALINKLSAERLLKGVVPSETYPSAPKGALRAQAVAARNTIFAAIGVRNLADPYTLRSDVYDQVYRGLEAETDRTSEAVDATRGEVMFYEDQIVEATYSANAGGFTENNENVWNAEPRPYLRGRPDAPIDDVPEKFRDGIDEEELGAFLDGGFESHAGGAPMGTTHLYRWETSVDAGTALEWLESHGREIEQIRDAEVSSRGKSGRAIDLDIEGTDGRSTRVEHELNIRRLFGGLKSGLFEMKLEHGDDGAVQTFHFKGAGYGHGVGMCQTGAIGMAASGRSYRDILDHYYREIELRELY